MESAESLTQRNLGAIFDAILDTDRDGSISAGDFSRLAAGVCAVLGLPDGQKAAAIGQAYQSWWEQLRAACDQDGDGFIEQAEYLRLFGLANVGTEVPAAGFARLDRDGDGRISTEEWRAGAAHAFLSDDPAHPGTAMFGLA